LKNKKNNQKISSSLQKCLYLWFLFCKIGVFRNAWSLLYHLFTSSSERSGVKKILYLHELIDFNTHFLYFDSHHVFFKPLSNNFDGLF
jgi:hypothetical protein